MNRAKSLFFVLASLVRHRPPFTTPTSTSIPYTPQPIFNPEAGEFIERAGGLDEYFLNSFPRPEYRTQFMLDYFQRVDNQEHRFEFCPLPKHEAKLSKIETVITAFDNMKIIGQLDNNDSEVDDHYKPLKELIRRCNEIYEIMNEGSIERAVSIYEIVSQYLDSGKNTSDSVSITGLADGIPAECDYLIPGYFALFNYYHVRCSIVFGEVEGENEKGERVTGPHTWLRVGAGGIEFELDPTWYKIFAPLKVRNYQIEPYYGKDEYMRFKV